MQIKKKKQPTSGERMLK